ncbi:DUF2079 domain-containing protein [Halegenticoccus tardaugens]|uniref:DUF2079 domain-containing protein n=1 Tax=Halegenticoccus tardaugens TaxID=2071624 RepID=UPI0011B5BFD2|nr:DUF2079 domain-containing protein [Halegenticoccus tardaugens]
MSNVPRFIERLDLSDGQTKRFVQYVIVGLVGIGINQGVLFVATGVMGISYVIGGTLSRVLSILANYVMNDSWTWGGRGSPGRREWVVRGLKYILTRVVGIGMGLGALILFVEVFGMHYLVANLFAIAVGIFWGFGASERWVWRSEDAAATGVGTIRQSLYSRVPGLDRRTWLVFALAATLCIIFSVYTSFLYLRFQLTGADFGSYVHMMWTTVNGEGFLRQGKYVATHPSGVYWGGHFTLTLLAFVPIFALVPSPITLLVAKSFVVAASIPVLWFLARRALDDDRLAALVTVSYALNPFLWSAWSFDFQEQCVLPILVFGVYALYDRGRYLGFLLLLFLALVTNEFMILVVAGFLVGLTVAVARDGRIGDEWPILVAAFALTAFAQLLSGYVISQYSVASGIPVRVLAIPLQSLVADVGPRVSIGTLLPLALANPDVIVEAIATDFDRKLLYLFAFFLPVLFLAATDEISLGALAPFLGFAWLLASKSAYYSFAAHYPFYVMPFVYIGAVRALDRLDVSFPTSKPPDATPDHTGAASASGRPADAPTRLTDGSGSTTASLRSRLPSIRSRVLTAVPRPRPRPSRRLFVRALALVVIVNAGAGLVIGGGNMQPVPPEDEHTETLRAGIAAVPEDASLVTQNDIYPHVAMRPDTSFLVSPYDTEQYERSQGPITPEYVLYDTELNRGWASIVVEIFGDRLGGEYGLYRYEDGVWIFQRGYDGTPRALTSNATWFEGPSQEYEADEFRIGSGRYDAADREIESRRGPSGDAIWYGPYEALESGTYTATFDVYASADRPGPAAALDVAAGSDHRVVGRSVVQSDDEWQEVSITFTLDKPMDKVEFRGFRTAPGGTVVLDDVTLVQENVSQSGADGNASVESAGGGSAANDGGAAASDETEGDGADNADADESDEEDTATPDDGADDDETTTPDDSETTTAADEDAETATPDDEDDETETPEDEDAETATPDDEDDETETPEDETETPEDETETPEDEQ